MEKKIQLRKLIREEVAKAMVKEQTVNEDVSSFLNTAISAGPDAMTYGQALLALLVTAGIVSGTAVATLSPNKKEAAKKAAAKLKQTGDLEGALKDIAKSTETKEK